ncbi:MAG: hypothetical protein RJB13_161 [Pseudomonadota bacterium]|jgi:hypothetical protein
MGEVLEFKTKTAAKKSKSSAAKSKANLRSTAHAAEPRTVQVKPVSKKKKEPVNSESIKLWWISQEFDDLIRKAVIDKHIPAEELAAVMAHRLGTLLMVSERTPEMTLFCMKIISKITNQPHPGTNAS